MRRRDCMGLALAGSLAAAAGHAAPAMMLRVVGSADPPFRIFAATGATGIYFDLVREAARRQGWALRFIELPSARALAQMRTGEADLMLGPLRTAEREAFMSYTSIQLPAEDKAFYSLPGARPVLQLADLAGRSLAVHRGKRYGAVFDAMSGLQRRELNDYQTALEMVSRGRVDLAVLPEREGDLMLKASGLPLVKQPLRLAGEASHVVLSRLSPWLARQAELERAFESMQQDGSWQRIVERY